MLSVRRAAVRFQQSVRQDRKVPVLQPSAEGGQDSRLLRRLPDRRLAVRHGQGSRAGDRASARRRRPARPTNSRAASSATIVRPTRRRFRTTSKASTANTRAAAPRCATSPAFRSRDSGCRPSRIAVPGLALRRHAAHALSLADRADRRLRRVCRSSLVATAPTTPTTTTGRSLEGGSTVSAAAPLRRSLVTPTTLVLAALVVVGFYFLALRLIYGLGAVTNHQLRLSLGNLGRRRRHHRHCASAAADSPWRCWSTSSIAASTIR